ncbi:Frag1/DRAM/Sfk1 family [Popillia japonica]|uniref:Frag1/DRAM/Sfk1 family n=1 Tax=Popillia japonica TaxID=7064 RepID=A0AAW1KHN1_POPJA
MLPQSCPSLVILEQTRRPESAIFGQLLNIGSVIMAVSIYVRYLQVKTVATGSKLGSRVRLLNLTCLWLGLLIALGVSIVANFQLSVAFVVHLIGTGFAIGFGVVFQVVQLYPHMGSKYVNKGRILIAFASCIWLGRCIPSYFSGLNCAGHQDRSIKFEEFSVLIDTVAEWMIILLTMAFILTFVYEFKRTTLQEIKFEISEIA